jgi:hypothetical protein
MNCGAFFLTKINLNVPLLTNKIKKLLLQLNFNKMSFFMRLEKRFNYLYHQEVFDIVLILSYISFCQQN